MVTRAFRSVARHEAGAVEPGAGPGAPVTDNAYFGGCVPHGMILPYIGGECRPR